MSHNLPPLKEGKLSEFSLFSLPFSSYSSHWWLTRICITSLSRSCFETKRFKLFFKYIKMMAFVLLRVMIRCSNNVDARKYLQIREKHSSLFLLLELVLLMHLDNCGWGCVFLRRHDGATSNLHTRQPLSA